MQESRRERGHLGESQWKTRAGDHMDPEQDLTGKLVVGVLAGGGNPRIMPAGGCIVRVKQKAK